MSRAATPTSLSQLSALGKRGRRVLAGGVNTPATSGYTPEQEQFRQVFADATTAAGALVGDAVNQQRQQQGDAYDLAVASLDAEVRKGLEDPNHAPDYSSLPEPKAAVMNARYTDALAYRREQVSNRAKLQESQRRNLLVSIGLPQDFSTDLDLDGLRDVADAAHAATPNAVLEMLKRFQGQEIDPESGQRTLPMSDFITGVMNDLPIREPVYLRVLENALTQEALRQDLAVRNAVDVRNAQQRLEQRKAAAETEASNVVFGFDLDVPESIENRSLPAELERLHGELVRVGYDATAAKQYLLRQVATRATETLDDRILERVRNWKLVDSAWLQQTHSVITDARAKLQKAVATERKGRMTADVDLAIESLPGAYSLATKLNGQAGGLEGAREASNLLQNVPGGKLMGSLGLGLGAMVERATDPKGALSSQAWRIQRTIDAQEANGTLSAEEAQSKRDKLATQLESLGRQHEAWSTARSMVDGEARAAGVSVEWTNDIDQAVGLMLDDRMKGMAPDRLVSAFRLYAQRLPRLPNRQQERLNNWLSSNDPAEFRLGAEIVKATPVLSNGLTGDALARVNTLQAVSSYFDPATVAGQVMTVTAKTAQESDNSLAAWLTPPNLAKEEERAPTSMPVIEAQRSALATRLAQVLGGPDVEDVYGRMPIIDPTVKNAFTGLYRLAYSQRVSENGGDVGDAGIVAMRTATDALSKRLTRLDAANRRYVVSVDRLQDVGPIGAGALQTWFQSREFTTLMRQAVDQQAGDKFQVDRMDRAWYKFWKAGDGTYPKRLRFDEIAKDGGGKTWIPIEARMVTGEWAVVAKAPVPSTRDEWDELAQKANKEQERIDEQKRSDQEIARAAKIPGFHR